jgi:prepilin-type processing-associated H-X9-DG protein
VPSTRTTRAILAPPKAADARLAAANTGSGGGGSGTGQGFARAVLRWWQSDAPCAIAGMNPPETACQKSCERRFQFSSQHVGGCHFAFADGHARFLSETMDVDVFGALLTRNGGKVVGEF